MLKTEEGLQHIEEDVLPPLQAKITKVFNYSAAIVGTLTLLGGVTLSAGAYIVTQEDASLQEVHHTVDKTGADVTSLSNRVQVGIDALDKRVTILEQTPVKGSK
jgi:hypothetical protein